MAADPKQCAWANDTHAGAVKTLRITRPCGHSTTADTCDHCERERMADHWGRARAAVAGAECGKINYAPLHGKPPR